MKLSRLLALALLTAALAAPAFGYGANIDPFGALGFAFGPDIEPNGGPGLAFGPYIEPNGALPPCAATNYGAG